MSFLKLSLLVELRSKFMALGESSEEGKFSRITLEFDTHLVSLKLQVLRHEISDKDNPIKLSSSDKELKKVIHLRIISDYPF